MPEAMPKMKLTSCQVERTSRGLVHCLAQCKECEWSSDSYPKAARSATAHVRQTGHTVGVEQVIVYTVRPVGRAPR